MQNFLVLFCFLLPVSFASIPLEAKLKINGEEKLIVEAGLENLFEINYINKTNGIKHGMFMPMHAKLMHMIVIKSDLSHFAHIHPQYSRASKTFSLIINHDTEDPDNQDLPNVIIQSGEYFIFIETMPMVMGQEHRMQMDRFLVSTKKVTEPFIRENFPEAKEGITKYFTHEGLEGSEGDYYKVTLSYEALEFCNYWLPKFYFTFEVKNENTNTYEEAHNFQPWLEMGGHAILLSAEKKKIEDRFVSHLHSLMPVGKKGEFVFPYDETNPPPTEGNYKIWGQFSHNERILTLAFAFKYTLPKIEKRQFCIE